MFNYRKPNNNLAKKNGKMNIRVCNNIFQHNVYQIFRKVDLEKFSKSTKKD